MVGGPGSRPGLRRFHLLHCGASRIARSFDFEQILSVLESHSRLVVATRSKRGLFVHAGAVAFRGRALVLPGASGSGKTTLVAELVRAGADYLSDEFAVIRGSRVAPFPKPLSVRNEKEPERQSALPVTALGGRQVRRSLPLGLVILSEFEPRSEWRPRILTRGRALLSLLAHTVPARIATEEVLAVLHGVVRSVPVVKLRRGEARADARRLLEWMERGPESG